ncbi:MAG TPA: MarC family protein [Acidobacteriota bacterium]|nr:MarC family protein [Acidobacteriota bacterium]
MIEIGKTILLIVSALLPVVNPLGGSPVFLSLTRHYSTPARMALARRVAINSFSLLIGSYLLGAHVLEFLGISLPVVQVGGGLVVISTGWTMLRRPDEEDERDEVQRSAQEKGTAPNTFYPLTLPLTVGPGSISVAITLGANAPYHYGATHIVILCAIIGSFVIAASIFLCYGFADRLERVIGPSAMNVILRLFTFLLICIGVQIFWNGASALITSVLLSAR